METSVLTSASIWHRGGPKGGSQAAVRGGIARLLALSTCNDECTLLSTIHHCTFVACNTFMVGQRIRILLASPQHSCTLECGCVAPAVMAACPEQVILLLAMRQD